MIDLSRVRAGAVVEAVGTLLLLTALVLEITGSSPVSECALALSSAVLFLAAAALTDEARRPWLLIIGGIALVIAVALLVRIVDAPLLNGLHLVPLTLIACAAAIGRRSAVRRRVLERQWGQARRDGEEQERGRWARELHDETLQELGAVQIVLATAAAGSGPEGVQSAIGRAQRMIGGQITSLRHLIVELRPAALDQLGLRAALEALCRNTTEVYGIDAEVRPAVRNEQRDEWDEHASELSPEAQGHVYRIAQEAVTNAVKHAAPSRIVIELAADSRSLTTTITDDGRGSRPTTPTTAPTTARAGVTAAPADSHGVGMAAMRERAELLGARLTVRSSPGEGTRVTLRIPRNGVGDGRVWPLSRAR